VPEHKSKILLVEDDLDVADMLDAYFRVQGYDVIVVNWGMDGVRAAATERPDLIILDIRLPDIDGFEVARRLRADRKTQALPIIFLTEKRARFDRLQGLELGAEDFINKPFDVQELRLRVRNALNRAGKGTLTNPVTGLADWQVVDEKVADLVGDANWSLLVVSLENLDAFREAYGFVASDDAVRAISLMIQNILEEAKLPEGILGHLDLADLVLAVPSSSAAELGGKIRSRLGQSMEYFYPVRDRESIDSNQQRMGVQVSMVPGASAAVAWPALKAELLTRKG
jgi:CheY-like chemotaxis protein